MSLQLTNRLWEAENKEQQHNNFPCPTTDPKLNECWNKWTYVVQIKPLVKDIISIWFEPNRHASCIAQMGVGIKMRIL